MIDRSGYQSKKTAGKNYYLSFFVVFTEPVSALGCYGTLLLSLILLKITAKKRTLFTGVGIYSRGIAGLANRRTAYPHAQRVDLSICAYNAREKFLIHKANISKSDPVTLNFCKKIFNSESGMHVQNCEKKIVEWNSSNFEISIFCKKCSTEFFSLFILL